MMAGEKCANCGLSVTDPCPAKFVRIVVVTVVVSQHLLVLLAFVMAMLQLGSPGGGVVFLLFSRTFFLQVAFSWKNCLLVSLQVLGAEGGHIQARAP